MTAFRTIKVVAAPTITAIKCNLGRSRCRNPAERATPTAPTVTNAWIMMLITLTTKPTGN